MKQFLAVFLSPLLEPYPDQKPQDPGLVWEDDLPNLSDSDTADDSTAIARDQHSDTAESSGE